MQSRLVPPLEPNPGVGFSSIHARSIDIGSHEVDRLRYRGGRALNKPARFRVIYRTSYKWPSRTKMLMPASALVPSNSIVAPSALPRSADVWSRHGLGLSAFFDQER